MLTEESQGSNSGTAITHDSDPRPLRFEMYDRDTGVTTDVGTGPVPLNWAASPTPIPPVPPPAYNPLLLSQLTGGSDPGSAPVINNLTAGDMNITLICTDATQLIGTITNAQIQALVIAQGQLNQTTGTLDLSTVFSIDTLVGKTIDSVTAVISAPYTCSMPCDFATSIYSFQGLLEGFHGTLVDTNLSGGPFANGPGLGIDVAPQSFISLVYTIAGYVAATNAVLAWVGAPVPTLDDLTMGGFETTITCTDATVVNLMTSLSTFRVVAEDMGYGSFRASASAMGWDLSALVGKSINDVKTTINPAFTGNSHVVLTESMSGLYYLPDLPPVINLDLTNTTTIDTPVSPAEAFTSPDDWWLYLGLFRPNYVAVPFLIDAATIQGLASPQALAADAWVDAPGHGDINWPSALLAPYVGWDVLFVQLATYPNPLPAPIDYGPGPFDPTNVLAFSFNGVEINIGTPTTYTTTNGVNLTLFPASGLISSDAFMSMQGSVPSWRISTSNASPAINLPLLFTEPYELRSRNLPAFYFDITGPTVHSETPTYNAIMFVSQDMIHWSPCSCDITQGYLGNIVHSTDLMTPSMPCDVFEIPNVGGASVIVNKKWTGPWNYIKFMLFANEPEGNPPTRHEQDLQDIYLQIIANAREL